MRSLLTSPRFYPLWRIGWFERAFFLTCRWLFTSNKPRELWDATVFGFDFSRWQGAIDFSKVIAYGAAFLIFRATYGVTRDERFIEYMAGLQNRLPFAVYGLYDPVYNPLEQARKLIDVCAPYKNNIRRVWLDLEFWWDGAYKDPKYWKVYRDTIAAAGYRVGWYTRATWWDGRVGVYAAEFGKDPVWAAQYAPFLTLIPKGWNIAMLWQRGTPAIGNAVGTGSAEVDEDIWNSDLNFVLEWDGATPPPPGGITMWKKAIGNITIRTGPGTTYPNATLDGVSQYVKNGDILEVSETQNGFAHIVQIVRAGVVVDIPDVSWCGTAYLVDTTAPPPPPPPVNIVTSNVSVTWTENVPTRVEVDGVIWKKE